MNTLTEHLEFTRSTWRQHGEREWGRKLSDREVGGTHWEEDWIEQRNKNLMCARQLDVEWKEREGWGRRKRKRVWTEERSGRDNRNTHAEVGRNLHKVKMLSNIACTDLTLHSVHVCVFACACVREIYYQLFLNYTKHNVNPILICVHKLFSSTCLYWNMWMHDYAAC